MVIVLMKYFLVIVSMMKFTFYSDKNNEIFEEKLEKHDDCFITFFDGIIIVICCDILKFVCDEKHHKLFKDTCIRDVIWCKKKKIILCSICTAEVFKKIDILHMFKLKS